MCVDLALIAGVERAAKHLGEPPGIGYGLAQLLGCERLGAAELAALCGWEEGLITRWLDALKRSRVITLVREDGNRLYCLAERFLSTKLSTAPSAHALAQRRYRERQKQLKSQQKPQGHAAGQPASRVITRDHPVITADHQRDHGPATGEKRQGFQPLAVIVGDHAGGSHSLREKEDHDNDLVSSSLLQERLPRASDAGPELERAQLVRKRWLDKMLREGRHILAAERYAKLVAGISRAEREQFILRARPFRTEIQATLDEIDSRLRARDATREAARQKHLVLPIDGGRADGYPLVEIGADYACDAEPSAQRLNM